ncbi:DODA-type extradiol aromatic ring-opening family dioxygenase [Pseudomonas sp. B22129]|uniref:DODA-type extradiol aromatic ring-opening family dioxygenase n=1 Tax=Pseudomonas sp. B22129 TaxID=3235111 RepID=UPI003783AA35
MHAPLPALFVSHGAPTFALDPGLAGARLSQLGRQLPKPQAIVVVSAHWMTNRAVSITAGSAPQTVHDFGGFPPELYELTYPAPGLPALANRIAALLENSNWPASLDTDRGLDHGAWVPLRHLYPQADIPVIQVSMPIWMTPQDALRLGQALAPLRHEGVLIMGSGSLTHNLYEFRSASVNTDYVQPFCDWATRQLKARDTAMLLAYRTQAPEAVRAHPSEEHFFPLFVALGAAGPDYEVNLIEGGVTYGVLSMDSYLFNASAPDTAPRKTP